MSLQGPGHIRHLVLSLRLQHVPFLARQRLAPQLGPGGRRPDGGPDSPVLGEQALRAQSPPQPDAGRHDLSLRALTGRGRVRGRAAGLGCQFRRAFVPVQAALQCLLAALVVGRRSGLDVGLVVDSQVVEDVLAVRVLVGRAVHPAQRVLDDVGQFVGPGCVVGNAGRADRRQQDRVAVVVLQALAGERGAPGGRAEQEPAAQLVAHRPHLVAGPLEAEHRVEDVHRDHRRAVGGIRGARRGR